MLSPFCCSFVMLKDDVENICLQNKKYLRKVDNGGIGERLDIHHLLQTQELSV